MLELLVHTTVDVTKFTTTVLHRTVPIPIPHDHDVHAQTSRMEDHVSLLLLIIGPINDFESKGGLTPEIKNKGTLLHQSITLPHLHNVSVMREDDAQVS